MFEERAIEILAYSLETVLAEKLETVISRATTNTRMRDFYNIPHFMSALWRHPDGAGSGRRALRDGQKAWDAPTAV